MKSSNPSRGEIGLLKGRLGPSRRVIRATLAAGAVATLVAALAGAQTPNPTLLVLQREDVPQWLTTGTAPQLTTDDGQASVSSTKDGRLSGAVSSYTNSNPNLGPVFVTSRAVIFRDATGAHGAFLEVSDKLARTTGSSGSAVDIGQEGRSYAVIAFSPIVWRHGNVLGYIETSGGRGSSGYAIDFARLQQTRIAALVPPANPGPPVVVKPVIGKPLAQPAQPRAGKRFTVMFRVTRSDDGTALTSASVTSTIRIAAKVVPHRYRFSAGQFKLTLSVPKTARGKRLKITVTVRAENRATTKAVTYKVR